MQRQPQDAPEEIIVPIIDAGISKPEVWIIPHGSTERERRVVEVVRSQEAEQAYMRIDSAGKRSLNHHGQGWGYLFLGVLLPRVEEGVFQEPDPTEATIVAIKRLRRAVVNRELARGNHENPMREIYRMQTIGDNIHVLGCIEALQDDTYLYIISPYCGHGTLENRGPMLEVEARAMFSQVLQSLAYIHHGHGICHRDISPGNVLLHANGRVVLNDLAMSFRIPPGGLLNPMGHFGKPAYWPLEIYMNVPFDAYACDLWAAVVTLFNLVTGEHMYNFPHPDDNLFRYCVMAQGVSTNPVNGLSQEVMDEVTNPLEITAIMRIARGIRSLTPPLLLLFEKSLSMNPEERWTLEDIQNCEWIRLHNDFLHFEVQDE
jgi:serine/threonine protein kinase